MSYQSQNENIQAPRTLSPIPVEFLEMYQPTGRDIMVLDVVIKIFVYGTKKQFCKETGRIFAGFCIEDFCYNCDKGFRGPFEDPDDAQEALNDAYCDGYIESLYGTHAPRKLLRPSADLRGPMGLNGNA